MLLLSGAKGALPVGWECQEVRTASFCHFWPFSQKTHVAYLCIGRYQWTRRATQHCQLQSATAVQRSSAPRRPDSGIRGADLDGGRASWNAGKSCVDLMVSEVLFYEPIQVDVDG